MLSGETGLLIGDRVDLPLATMTGLKIMVQAAVAAASWWPPLPA